MFKQLHFYLFRAELLAKNLTEFGYTLGTIFLGRKKKRRASTIKICLYFNYCFDSCVLIYFEDVVSKCIFDRFKNSAFLNFWTRKLFSLQHRALYLWYYISSGSCQITISALALPCSWYGVLSAICDCTVPKKVDVSLCSQVGLQGSEIPRWCLCALLITSGIIR